MNTTTRTGGQIFVDQLLIQGAKTIFCVPGESFLSILDAVYSKKNLIKLINARHEAAASHMAEAYGKLQRKPGVVMVSRGPGACHASVGVHVAYQDSSPLILIVGQVPQLFSDKESFQEIDYKIMFKNITKAVLQIDDIRRIPEYISRAFTLSLSGRPGPVVISVPENILEEKNNVKDFKKNTQISIFPDYSKLDLLKEKINNSKKPILIVGSSSWTENSSSRLTNFAMKNFIPVVSSFRRQDIIDNTSSVFVGSLGTSVSQKLLKKIHQSDFLLIVGSRFGEMSSEKYTLLGGEKKFIVHFYPDANEIGKLFQPDMHFVSTVAEGVRMLEQVKSKFKKEKKKWLDLLKKEFIQDIKPKIDSDKINLSKIFSTLSNEINLPSIITLDAGNHTGWPQRFISYGNKIKQVGSTCGCMGYSIPAAISASLQYPEKKVISIVGDGGFMMTGMEIMTAIQYKINLIVLIINNNSFGTIKMHQEIKFPKRSFSTSIKNPDFVLLAKSMGALGKRVNKTDDFLSIFKKALSNKNVSVIEISTNLKEITTRMKLEELSN